MIRWLGNGKRFVRQRRPDRSVTRDGIANFQDRPQQFGDGAAMPIRTPHLDAITPPCTFAVSDQLAAQRRRRWTVLHPRAEPMRNGAQQMIADGSGKHIGGRTATASVKLVGAILLHVRRHADDSATRLSGPLRAVAWRRRRRFIMACAQWSSEYR